MVARTAAAIKPRLGIALGLVALVVALALPFTGSIYNVYLGSLILVYGVLAVSLNLVLGHGGMLQLHQGVYFGVGAYAVAILTKKAGFAFVPAVIAAPLVAALVAVVISWFLVRLRGLYFGMLAIAMGQVIWALAERWTALTGGGNGLHSIPVPDLIGSSITSTYYLMLAMAMLSLLLMYRLLKAPFGLVLRAIRDNPERASASGINVRQHQLFALVISAAFSGLAGAMYAIMETSVAPGIVFWQLSAKVLIMCLLGGLTTFWGPLAGAAVIELLENYLSSYTSIWLIVLGGILLLLVLFLPDGLLGSAQRLFEPGAGPDRDGTVKAQGLETTASGDGESNGG